MTRVNHVDESDNSSFPSVQGLTVVSIKHTYHFSLLSSTSRSVGCSGAPYHSCFCSLSMRAFISCCHSPETQSSLGVHHVNLAQIAESDPNICTSRPKHLDAKINRDGSWSTCCCSQCQVQTFCLNEPMICKKNNMFTNKCS